jgi:alanine-glyoxylate transaminase/serine-glyoxylate transaminase/serine-pyruvate transaminase
MIHTGRHFLQIPGPTNVPDRVLRAMDRPVIDHRSAEFASLGAEVLEGMRAIFQTKSPVVMYPASGTGAWEAALVNTLSPCDRVLLFETGHFSQLWRRVAEHFGVNVEYVPGNWRRGASASELEARLGSDKDHSIKAVLAVHNETSTGVTSRIPDLRRAMNQSHHPALLMVDTISSLACIDYRHDEWEVDVTIAGSQKGLMLPPGMSFNAISEKALLANASARLPRSYWDWQEMLKPNRSGFFPYTPPTNLLYGLRETLQMLQEEGLPDVLHRHDRHAEATRAAVRAWELEIVSGDRPPSLKWRRGKAQSLPVLSYALDIVKQIKALSESLSLLCRRSLIGAFCPDLRLRPGRSSFLAPVFSIAHPAQNARILKSGISASHLYIVLPLLPKENAKNWNLACSVYA